MTAPEESAGQRTWLMKTFQAWPASALASASCPLEPAPEPYQTPSARPAAPARIQGIRFTASPVRSEPSLTCTGADQVRQPVSAAETVSQICCRAGLVEFSVTNSV